MESKLNNKELKRNKIGNLNNVANKASSLHLHLYQVHFQLVLQDCYLYRPCSNKIQKLENYMLKS